MFYFGVGGGEQTLLLIKIVRLFTTSEQEPPQAMIQLHKIAETEQGWLWWGGKGEQNHLLIKIVCLFIRPNKKISVIQVTCLKILGRVGTHIFF